MNDRQTAPSGKKGGNLFRQSLKTFALMLAGVLFAVVIVRLALYYTVIKPFEAGFTDPEQWNRLLMVLFIVGFVLVSVVWLFVLYRKEGYRAGAFTPGAAVLPVCIASAVHLALSAVFRGHWVLSGAGYFAAWLVSFGGMPLEEGERVPLGLILLFLLVFDVVYAAVMLLAQRLGASQRQKDRHSVVG